MLITLLTDFGDRDGFVGAMRGVILSRAPQATLVDLAHHVPPGDVVKGAQVLARAAPCFPTGTIHLVVIDPGVGSPRRSVALRAGGHRLIGPDNGVLLSAAERLGGVEIAHALTDPAHWLANPSGTFHGRDIFAPVAGAVASGLGLSALGPAIDELVRLSTRPPRRGDSGLWIGRVVEIDRFGNLITDLPTALVEEGQRVCVEIRDLRIVGPSSAYATVPSGRPVLVPGSEGTLEIAVRDGSAAKALGVSIGEPVRCDTAPRALST